MAKNKPNVSFGNDGENQGVMAGVVDGNVDNSTNTTTILLPEKRRKLPSLIPKIIDKLAELTIIPDEEIDKLYKVNIDDTIAYDINKKISHNHLIKYKGIIEEYSQYGSICEEAFNIVDNNFMGCKTKILKSIKLLYDHHKGQVLLEYKDSKKEEIDIIRENADSLIDIIKDVIERRILEDESVNLLVEDLDVGLIRILCYSFVECKILERPLVTI